MLFLDCYGRIFDWDDIIGLLRTLGKYLDERKAGQVVWDVEFDGTISEFDYFE